MTHPSLYKMISQEQQLHTSNMSSNQLELMYEKELERRMKNAEFWALFDDVEAYSKYLSDLVDIKALFESRNMQNDSKSCTYVSSTISQHLSGPNIGQESIYTLSLPEKLVKWDLDIDFQEDLFTSDDSNSFHEMNLEKESLDAEQVFDVITHDELNWTHSSVSFDTTIETYQSVSIVEQQDEHYCKHHQEEEVVSCQRDNLQDISTVTLTSPTIISAKEREFILDSIKIQNMETNNTHANVKSSHAKKNLEEQEQIQSEADMKKDSDAMSIEKIFIHYSSPMQSPGIKGIYRYRCPFKDCEKTFSTSGHARRHSRLHSAFRRHHCPHGGCNATFTRRDNCKDHQRKTHNRLL